MLILPGPSSFASNDGPFHVLVLGPEPEEVDYTNDRIVEMVSNGWPLEKSKRMGEGTGRSVL